MSASLRAVGAGVVGAVLALVVWAQDLVICRACGREVRPGAAACAHCSQPVALLKPAEPAAARPPDAEAEREAALARLAQSAVSGSLRQARELEKQQPAVALSYYHNALALLRLLPAGSLPAGLPEEILSGTARTMGALLQGQVPCRRCNGSGKYQMDLGRVMQKGGGVKAVEGVACPACKGAGGFAGYRDIARVKMDLLQGRQEFERRQMAVGDVRAGRALLPVALDQALDTRRRALVMTGVPVPCGACQLTARQKCMPCKGAGWVPCAYSGCEDGVVAETRSTSGRTAKRLNDEAVKKCPKCGGLAEVPCPSCKGVGNVACAKCAGSGQAPRCSRCTGTGLLTCAKCKGTGELKGGTCPECKGEKICLCTTCRGEGALAR